VLTPRKAAGIRFWVLTGDKTETAVRGLRAGEGAVGQPSEGGPSGGAPSSRREERMLHRMPRGPVHRMYMITVCLMLSHM